MTAAPEKAWVSNGRPPTGKGLLWEANFQECEQRGWWGRWGGERWELVTADAAGAVGDLARLAAFRAGQVDDSDAAWAQVLTERAEAERMGVHRKEAKAAKRLAGRESN